MRYSAAVRRLCVVAALLLSVVTLTSAAAPPKAKAGTDVMFVFDTTGSMGGALTAAKSQIQEAMAQISASLPDTQFGLATVADYPFASVINKGLFVYGSSGDQPWTLKSPITTQTATVTAEMLKLNASGGGDGPESYGRALFESANNPAVGWRSDSRGVIVLVADNVPHDDNLNEGLPEELKKGTIWDTGIDPGPDNTVGTPDDIDWQATLQQLILAGKPLAFVAYQGETYLPHWKVWAGSTGGSAVSADAGNFTAQILETIKAARSAPLPSCPPGQVRDSGDRCVVPPSNRFKFEPRISCSRGCRVVMVKIEFDSAGNVIGESIPEEEGKLFASLSAQGKGKAAKPACKGQAKGKGAAKGKGKASASAGKGKGKGAKGKGSKCKVALIQKLSQAVVAGRNTLSLKLTGAAFKSLKKKGKLKLKLRFTFTPSGAGGTPKTLNRTFTVKMPAPKRGKKGKGAKGRGGAKVKGGGKK